MLPRYIPQREFDAVPQSQLVINQAQIILDYMFRGSEILGDFAVLATLGYALDDEVLALAWGDGAC
jgi:hypothetical protein